MTASVLLLWDVDHTLIENAGVSKENYALAFELLAGRPPEVEARTDGRTDVAIMADLITSNGEDVVTYPAVRQWEALTEAGRRNAQRLAERGHALAGAADALAHLAADPEIIQSALTGNIEANAKVKLGAFGLDRWIDFEAGGFGTESAVRADLVPVAQHKAQAKYGFDPDKGVTVVVGDTELDVEAGLNGGARVIAVATGPRTVQELREAGAHAVLPDLSDLDAVLAALASVRQLGPVTAE
jgi:phosphoglycolate phosphatase-like HAD superfamily hydrolase